MTSRYYRQQSKSCRDRHHRRASMLPKRMGSRRRTSLYANAAPLIAKLKPITSFRAQLLPLNADAIRLKTGIGLNNP